MGSISFRHKRQKVGRAAKKHGLYTFSEITEDHTGLIAAAGIAIKSHRSNNKLPSRISRIHKIKHLVRTIKHDSNFRFRRQQNPLRKQSSLDFYSQQSP